MSEIDYEPLRRAIHRLRESINERKRLPSNDFVRDSVVQRFEFTYELSAALLRRFLKEYKVKQGDEYDLTFPSLIRAGSEVGLLLHGWDRWFDYRKARNTTSHAYDEESAKLVTELAPVFLEEAEYLYKETYGGDDMTTVALDAPPIAVTEEQWAILADVLARYATGRPVLAYGSRARGVRVRPYSDLDLILGGPPLRGEEAWKLEEALDESRLPFRVELQHESLISAEFRERIAKDFVVVQSAGVSA